MKKKTTKKIIKKRLVKKRPPAWVRVSGGSFKEPKLPKIKLPRGCKITDQWKGHSVTLEEMRKIDIEKYTLAYILSEIKDICGSLMDGKEVIAYNELITLGNELIRKGKVLEITRYCSLNKNNQISKVNSTHMWIKPKEY